MQEVALSTDTARGPLQSMRKIVEGWRQKNLVPVRESRSRLPFSLVKGKEKPTTIDGNMIVIRRNNNTVLFLHAGHEIEESFEDGFLLSLVISGQTRSVSIRLADIRRAADDKRRISVKRENLKEMLLTFGIMNAT